MASEVREMKLEIWQEIVGDCIRFQATKDQVAIILRVYGQNVRIAFKHGSREGIILMKIGRKLVGRKLGILRTDNEMQPIVIRIISQGASTQ